MLGQEPSGPLPLQVALTTTHRSTARTTARLLAVAVLVGGCAASADVAGLATQDELLRLRTDVTALQRSVQQARAQTEALGGQVTTIQATNQRLDSLTATLAALTRRVEDLTIRVETLGRQMRTAGAPTPRPVPTPPPPAVVTPPPTAAPTPRPVPTPPPPAAVTPPPTAAPTTAAPVVAAPVPPTAAPAAPPAPPPPGPTTAAPGPAPTRPSTGALQPQDLYQAAYIDFSKGSYPLAIEGFREFLRRYPDHPQANSAQYWIGESHVALAQQATNAGQPDRATEALQRAVQEFRKVVANYPRGDKAPTALYKEALTLIELKQPAVAQARLQYLVDNFPQAEETPLARERLAALRQR
jgi:tol-pal system protein YbgF